MISYILEEKIFCHLLSTSKDDVFLYYSVTPLLKKGKLVHPP